MVLMFLLIIDYPTHATSRFEENTTNITRRILENFASKTGASSKGARTERDAGEKASRGMADNFFLLLGSASVKSLFLLYVLGGFFQQNFGRSAERKAFLRRNERSRYFRSTCITSLE